MMFDFARADFRQQQGAVMAETALTLGIALLLILGTAQVSIIGFSQISADGAAFVAAHTSAMNPSVNPAQIVAQTFPGFVADSVNVNGPAVTGITGTQRAVVSKTVGGFIALPGAAAAYNLNGADIEAAAQTVSPQPFSFGVSAILANYCGVGGRCILPSSYQMYVAQNVDETTNAQGWNGAFAEWRCHQQAFASLNFPQNRPTVLKGSPYDPNNPQGVEQDIYAWDSGNHACK